MPGANVETTELFRNDIPVLRTSLARHGLVDLSVPPAPRRLPVEVRMPLTCWVPNFRAVFED